MCLCLAPTGFLHRQEFPHPLPRHTHTPLGDPALLLSHISVMSQPPSLGAPAQPS